MTRFYRTISLLSACLGSWLIGLGMGSELHPAWFDQVTGVTIQTTMTAAILLMVMAFGALFMSGPAANTKRPE